MTGGYHLCSLEALSQGLITIAYLDEKTQQAIHKVVGKLTTLPWINTTCSSLEQTIINLSKQSHEYIQFKKQYSREWMEKYWHPRTMVKHYLKLYKKEKYEHIDASFSDNNEMGQAYSKSSKIFDSVIQLRNSWVHNQVVIWGNGPNVFKSSRIVYLGKRCKTYWN